MRIAIVQISSPDNEAPVDRIHRVERLLTELPPVDLIVLPELWSSGYFPFDRYQELAEDDNGPTVSMITQVARHRGVYIHLGSYLHRRIDGKILNTSALIDPSGDVVHRYAKIHVFGYRSREAELLTPGTALPVTELPFGKTVGITCYDLRFPGLWSELSSRGAEIAIIPAAWPISRREHWRLLTSARAVEHQMFVIACNASGVQDGVELAGGSRVLDPTGNVLGECGPGPSTLIVEIDPNQVSRVREDFPVINDRLDTYVTLEHEVAS